MSSSTDTQSPWSIRNFRLYSYVGLLLPFAAQIQSLVIGWQVYEIKKDPLFLGLIGLTEALPGLSLALWAGVLVDRSNPLRIYQGLVWLSFFSAVLLLLTSNPWIPMDSNGKMIVLYLAAFFAGVARGFRMPSTTALVPRLVPREMLHVSSAWSTSTFALASAVGPALGGLLYAVAGGPVAPYLLDALVILAALILILQIKIDYVPSANERKTSRWQDLTSGVRFVFKHDLLLSALALDMFAVLFGGAVAMLPVFAADVLQVGAWGLGVLRAAPSIGTLIGSGAMIRFPPQKRSGVVLLATVTGFGLCMIGFAYSTSLVFSCLMLGLGGLFDSVSMVIRGAIVQLSTPNDMKGRVGAVNSIFIGVSNQLGEFESGVAATLMGTVPSVAAGGVVTLLVVAFTAVKFPRLRRMHLKDL